MALAELPVVALAWLLVENVFELATWSVLKSKKGTYQVSRQAGEEMSSNTANVGKRFTYQK